MQAQINAYHNDESHKEPAAQLGGVMVANLSRIARQALEKLQHKAEPKPNAVLKEES